MIEIELKYRLKNKFNLDKEIKSKKIVEDIYYDTKDYTLLKKGNFLRVRNGKELDFKLSANDLTHLYCKETNYELKEENKEEIEKILSNLDINVTLETIYDLFTKLKVLAPIKKKRTSYQLEDNVILVLDEVEDLGNFLEVEYDVDKDAISKEEGEYYKNYLLNLLKKNNLFNENLQEVHIGYVELYLKEFNKEAYNLGLYQE
ncbi:MAG: CYTH domain-containing protein [Ruminococcus sp.]|nr:CYTH domain-containing protein [Ruminococcus sp.]